ncbi:MAG: VWA domain-containing protein, partial [Anaerolineales bacterium]|nr:VWA domain-containing protein [Anaerolineales bacterium]
MNDFSWTQIGAHIPRLSTRGCRRRLFGCFILLMLFLAGLCGLLFWLVRPSSAQSPASTAVYLVIDNSNSMFEMGGIGADPDLLRLDAARLFISYLGVDQNRAVHQCGVIFFGSQADVVVPLTPLTDDSRRAELFSLLGEPDRMGWSDHAEALALAHKQLRLAQPHGRSAIIFLTDGKPEWSNAPTAVEQAAYIARLKQISRELAASQTDLFMIL